MSENLLISRAEVDGVAGVDVRVERGTITAVGRQLQSRRGEDALDGSGGALVPGLHDHHVHLLALAAAEHSVRCGPPDVNNGDELRRALQSAAAARDPGDWVRGVGYHESVSGPLDRYLLDGFVSDRPLRVQHASGAAWFLNSQALARVGLDGDGRLFGLDEWLRRQIGDERPPDLAPVGRRLAAFGVTGVTDATATNGVAEAAILRAARLSQRVLLMGSDDAPGPRKIVLEEHDLPSFDFLTATVRAAHAQDRPVAVHCVTRAALLLALAAFESAGTRRGDRIEHASVAPPEAVTWIRRLDLTVVTQPNFVAERGDRYRTDVDSHDRPWLYRVRGFLDAGVPLGAGTDAPFGDPDPWRAMRAAVDRRTASGAVLGGDERVSPEAALALFTTGPHDPGRNPRRVAAGEPGDLCLLWVPWRDARAALSSELVRTVVRGGSVLYAR